MPFQQIQLDQSIYKKPQPSPYSQALTPQKRASGGGDPGGNSFVDRQKEQWAMEDKLKKLERDKATQGAQEMGMRIRADYEKRKVAGREQSAKIEKEKKAMPGMAKALWSFAQGLDEEGQQNILASARAKPGMWAALKKEGLVTGDNKFVQGAKEPVEDAWYYNAEDNLMYNRSTGEGHKIDMEKFGGVEPDMIADAMNFGSQHMGRLMDPSKIEGLTGETMAGYIVNARLESQIATTNYLISQGVDTKTAHDIGFSIPIEQRTPPKEGEEEVVETDKEIVKNLVALEEANPGAIEGNKKAYEDKYGVKEVAAALDEVGKKPEGEKKGKEELPTLGKGKKKGRTLEEIVADFMKRISERRGLEQE